MQSVKVIILAGLVLIGQCVTAREYTPCELANQDVMRVIQDIQEKDQEFQQSSADNQKAAEAFNSSKLAADYEKLLEPYSDRDPLVPIPEEVRSNDIFVQYQAENRRLTAQSIAIYDGLDQRTEQNPIYQEAVQRAERECTVGK